MILLICGIKNWQTYNKTELETDTGNKQEVARGGKGEEQKRNRWRKLGSADFQLQNKWAGVWNEQCGIYS